MPDILIRDHTGADQPAAGWVELTDHYRWIYDDPSTGRDDPGTGFGDYLATPERIASWVAELAGSVVGLTGVFEPGRRNWSSSLPAGAVRKSAGSSSEESFREPHHAVTNTSPSGGRQRATSAPSASSTTPASGRGPGFRLRHDAQRQLVAAGRRSWMRLHRMDVLRVSSCGVHCEGHRGIGVPLSGRYVGGVTASGRSY
jgi:hypothetical protein